MPSLRGRAKGGEAMTTLRHMLHYLTAGAACLLGGGSLLVYTLFLFFGSVQMLKLDLGPGRSLLFDAGLSLLFFAQHSGMVRRSFRQRLARLIPGEFHSALYAIASGIALLLVVLCWQEGAELFIVQQGFLRWSLRAFFCLALLGMLWGVLSLESFDPCGIRPLFGRVGGEQPGPVSLTVKGPYRLVRHPLYLFSIVMLWCFPDLTTDRLLFNLLWTSWIIVGAFLEERDLFAVFGASYREYQRRVPMLLPRVRSLFDHYGGEGTGGK
jgi:protein-S-isoprenylcysteine O-methyltransferase Ste14